MKCAAPAIRSVADLRQKICREVYWMSGRENEPAVMSFLPPADHLLTFRWLVEGRKLETMRTSRTGRRG